MRLLMLSTLLVLAGVGLWVWSGCSSDDIKGKEHSEVFGRPESVKVADFSFGKPDCVLIVTGGTNARLEMCNCAGPMPGGLARRSGLINSYREAFKNVMIIDSGDAFWVEPDDVRNEYLLKAYGQIGYDALVLGDQEWAAYPESLPKWLKEYPLNCLSTTVAMRYEGNDIALHDQLTSAMFGKTKIAVISDIRSESFQFIDADKLSILKFAPPSKVIALATELKKQGCVVFVVAHVQGPVAAHAVSLVG